MTARLLRPALSDPSTDLVAAGVEEALAVQAQAAAAVLVLAGEYEVAVRALPADAAARQPGAVTAWMLAAPAGRALSSRWRGEYAVLDHALAVVRALPTAALAGRAMGAMAALLTRSGRDGRTPTRRPW